LCRTNNTQEKAGVPHPSGFVADEGTKNKPA